MPSNGINFNQGLTKYLKIPRIMAHCQDEPEWKPQNDDEQWWCESRMGINETRMMYDSISYYLSIWPGPPQRPEQEHAYLCFLRNRLFAAMMEYNLLNNEVEEEE